MSKDGIKTLLCLKITCQIVHQGNMPDLANSWSVDLLPNNQNFDLNKSKQKFHHSLKEHHKISNIPKFLFRSFCITHGKWIPLSEKRYEFPVRNTKWLKNGKLRRAILSAFYNISQRNFGILLILWCSFKLWWNFCPDLSRSKLCLLGNRSIALLQGFNLILDKLFQQSSFGAREQKPKTEMHCCWNRVISKIK
jgi:hypothetical protein